MRARRTRGLLTASAVALVVVLVAVAVIGRDRSRSTMPPVDVPTESTATSTPPPPTVSPPTAPSAPSTGVEVDPAAIAAAETEGEASVIVRLDVEPSGDLAERTAQVRAVLDRVLDALPPGSYSDVSEGLSVATVPLTVDRAGLEALATADAVASVRATRTFTVAALSGEDASWAPMSVNATTVAGVPTAWAAGERGAGVSVAVLDTGVDASHPFLLARTKTISEGCFASPRTGFTSPCPGGVSMSVTSAPVVGSAAPCPSSITNCDHGTHVAGIAVGGTGTVGTPVSGIAPAADLVAVNVFSYSSSTGRIFVGDDDLIVAMEWLRRGKTPVADGGTGRFPTLAAVNLSLGDGALFTGECPNDPLRPSVDQLAALGVSTVVAAGNQGRSTGVSSPACIPGVIAVGALDDASGQVASFSNDGPQVDVLAPGVFICSSVPAGSAGGACPAPNGGAMRSISGTSMAAPAVTGAIAVLRADGVAAADVVGRLQRVAIGTECVQASAWFVPPLRVDAALGLTARRTTPCAPGAPVATVTGPGSASVSWTAPLFVGTGSLTTSTVTASTGQTCTVAAPATSCTVSGAGPGPVSFTVRAGSTTGAGPSSVASAAVNLGLPPGAPIGSFDVVRAGPASLTVSGWTIDPDTIAPTPVHVYVDNGWGGWGVANATRTDVGAAFPPYGPSHGFNVTIPAAGGPRTVCVYAIDVAGPGGNPLLGCRTVTVPTGAPIGSLDVVVGGPGSVLVGGWTIDPDTVAPAPVHVYVDGRWGGALDADAQRPDVGAFFVGYGSAHGFSGSIPAAAGSRTVCVYAINVAGPGGNPLLGCRTVTVPTGAPIGSLEVASGGVGSVTVTGWALDPDTAASIPIHIYVGPAWGGALTAGVVRPELGAFFPAYGPGHGFTGTVPATAGVRSVCAYAIDVAAPGGNVLVGCRTVTVT